MTTERLNRTTAEKVRDAALHDEAWTSYMATGVASVTCYECASVIQFEKLAGTAYKSTCSCGRFDCEIRA